MNDGEAFDERLALVRRRTIGVGLLGLRLVCLECGYRFLKTPWYNPPCKKDGKHRLCPNCDAHMGSMGKGGASPPRRSRL